MAKALARAAATRLVDSWMRESDDDPTRHVNRERAIDEIAEALAAFAYSERERCAIFAEILVADIRG